jgi:hypothetical protein
MEEQQGPRHVGLPWALSPAGAEPGATGLEVCEPSGANASFGGQEACFLPDRGRLSRVSLPWLELHQWRLLVAWGHLPQVACPLWRQGPGPS